ncbi:hypothetical protein BH24ACT5_BH24ACT5_16940 [soil metagenome]
MISSAGSTRQPGWGSRSIIDESRLIREPVRLALHLPRLLHRTPCPAQIIVLPGLGANDASTIPLRCYLRAVGHHVQGWELGTHQRHVLTTLQQFSRRLGAAVERTNEPITLIGWSLGGVIAREAARERPEHVAQVITMGSPINGPGYSSTRRRRPIPVPVTTIYSRRDSVVNWRNALDHDSPTAVNIEVTSSHFGLGLDPDVWRIIVDTIDHPPPVVSTIAADQAAP